MKKLLAIVLSVVMVCSIAPFGAVGAEEFCEHLNKSSKWDNENHWTECNDCNEKFNIRSHTIKYTNDGDTHSISCENCDYLESGLMHDFDQDGNYYFECFKCRAIHNSFFEGNYLYSISNNEAIILDAVGILDSDLIIPSTLGGYPVVSIDDYVFAYCDNLTSITIPDSVEIIGNYAFENCYNLTNVTLGNSVKSIGNYAFAYCDNLTSITIPDSVEIIGNYAFENCYNLTNVTLGNSVKSIGNYAFDDCYNLTDVWYKGSETDKEKIEISSGNSRLEYANWHYCNGCINHSFATNECGEKCINCDFVKEHKMVTKYNDNNHWTACENPNCTERTAYIPHETTLKAVDYFSHGNACTCGYAANLEYHTYLCDNEDYYDYVCDCGLRREAFYYNGLTYCIENGGIEIINCKNEIEGNLEIPNTSGSLPVTSIGDYAFGNCYKLASITIPDNVESIGDSAFRYCENLTNVTLGNSVKSIGNYAFAYCDNLTSITIPDSVESIGDYAFRYCENLTDVWYEGSVTDKNNIKIEGGNEWLEDATWHYICKDGHEFSSNKCNTKCKNCEFKIQHPEFFTKYDSLNHWQECTKCHEKMNIESHGDDAYTRNDDGLTHNIDCSCGYKAENEEHDFVLYDDDEWGDYYRCGCYLHPNKYENEFTYFVKDGKAIITDYDEEYIDNVIVPSTLGGYPVTEIGYRAFANCGMINVTIPNSVISIEKNAFYGNYGLEKVYYSGSETDSKNIIIGDGNDSLKNGTWNYNSNGPCAQHSWKNATCTEPMTCTVCGKTEGIEKGHNYTQKVVTPATCKNTGIMNYKCTVCGDSFNETISKTTKHDYKRYITNATYAKAGSVVVKCSICGTVKSRSTIAILKPKTTKISKLIAKKKSLVVKIKRNKSVTGYEIQYSFKKNFKSAKKVTLKKNSSISKTIKKLKSKKTYYVRVRTYKTHKGKKYYSAWSKAVKKKTK